MISRAHTVLVLTDNAAIAGGISGPVGLIPGVPSLPTIIPPMPSGLNQGAPQGQGQPSQVGPGTGAGGQAAARAMARSPSPAPIGGSTDDLSGLGVDVELLSSESFRPEDCESRARDPYPGPPLSSSAAHSEALFLVLKQSLPTGRGVTQMKDLRELKARLESAMKVTEFDLQRSVFKCDSSHPSLPSVLRSDSH